MLWPSIVALSVSICAIFFCGWTLVRLLAFDRSLQQARETSPRKQTEELLAFCGTLRKEFAGLLESQDSFRDKVMRESQRVAALIRRRIPPEQGRRYDLEKQNGDEPDVITAEEAQARAEKAQGTSAEPGKAVDSREESRARIRAAWYAARGMR